ncbi:MAG: DUF2029 domain-containing protein [Sphingomonas sp.]|nr:DUF2029 domain-containing protein [Sphingomonas sp.]
MIRTHAAVAALASDGEGVDGPDQSTGRMSQLVRRFYDSQLLLWFAPLVLLAGLAFVIFRAVVAPAPEVDFRFFWLAGELWESGIDPYSESFRQIGADILPPGNVVIYWFYPPQWWIVCRALALMDLPQAVMAWRLLSGFMILVGTLVLVTTLAGGRRSQRLALAALVSGVALLIEPTANLLAFGQSAGLVYLSLALFVAGVLRKQAWLIGLAIFIATFKPQVGAPMIVMVLIVPAFRLAALGGLTGAGLLALPQLLRFGWLTTIEEFLSNLRAWDNLGSNTPETSSGPINLLTRLGIHGIGLGWQMALAFGAMAFAGWLLRRRPDRSVEVMFFLAAAICALMPLHIYDLTILIIPLVLFCAISVPSGAVLAIAAGSLLLLSRPGRAELWLGLPQYGSNVSAGLIGLNLLALLLFGLALHAMLRRRVNRVHKVTAQGGDTPRSSWLPPREFS